MILHDFIGFERPIPKFFDEGVAQLYEAGKKDQAERLMGKLVKNNQSVPLAVLRDLDIRKETDSKKVTIFYAESLSIVDFLIHEYGAGSFADLCRNLKDGKSMDDALHGAYTSFLDSLAALEERWLKYINVF